MNNIAIAALFLCLGICNTASNAENLGKLASNSATGVDSVLNKDRWIHGSEDCQYNEDSALDIYTHDTTSFIIRQNKCMTFEAPFIFVLAGDDKVLILDTGAIDDPKTLPLYENLQTMINEHHSNKKIVVVHSHGHSDHYAGDSQFIGKSGVTVVGVSLKDMSNFYGFKNWPLDLVNINLGGRELTIIPTPGHQEEAIAIYDHKTKWLLTGDTLYPGFIYVKNWQQYKSSILRLIEFSKTNQISAILGTHIESKRQSKSYYKVGATYQPDEASLDLSVDSLLLLGAELEKHDSAQTLEFDHFMIKPLGVFPKTISNIVRWFKK